MIIDPEIERLKEMITKLAEPVKRAPNQDLPAKPFRLELKTKGAFKCPKEMKQSLRSMKKM